MDLDAHSTPKHPAWIAEESEGAARGQLSLVKPVDEREYAPANGVVLISLGVILVVAAVAGGLAVHSLLWLLLILALIVFAIGVFTGRIDDA